MMSIRTLWLTCAFFAGSIASVFGAVPVARIGSNIEENAIIEPGDPLEFTADSLTDKEKCKWKVLPANTLTGKPTHKISADKRTLIIFSRVGRYDIRLSVWNDEDMVDVERTITVGKPTIVVGPPPKPDQPPPKPDPIPDPLPIPFGFDKVIANSVRLNVPASERGVAVKLAENYRIGATNIANGTWPIDKAIKNQSEMNLATPGYKRDVWSPVFKDIADRLADVRSEGQLVTQKHYVAVWAELSFGFSEVAK